MVLSSTTAYKHIIDPCKTAKPQQHGVDLTIDRICYLDPNGATGVYSNKSTPAPEVEVQPNIGVSGSWTGWWMNKGVYSIYFEQGVKVPQGVKANIIHRSSIARCGGQIYSGEYDPGFETEKMGAFLVVHSPFFIEKGARVAQIVMQQVEEGAELYAGQYQGK